MREFAEAWWAWRGAAALTMLEPQIFGRDGGRSGTRTPDPLIKSQLLYQLS